jgi:cytochrome c553
VEEAEANLSLLEGAIAAGLGDHDMADVAVHLRRLRTGGVR